MSKQKIISRNRNTYEEGRNKLKSIIIENISNDQYINIILALYSENIIATVTEEKIKSLVCFCESIPDIIKYISKILTILQNLISEQYLKLFDALSRTYGKLALK